MPDIFLSYSREDQAVARLHAEAFAREGFDVWWDQALTAGETFDEKTERALREARAVVVLWSKRSVESRWVRSEATIADRLGRLVPVSIEPCERPILFELVQTPDLAGWAGNAADPRWRALVDGVRKLVDGPGAASVPSAAPAPAAPLALPDKPSIVVLPFADRSANQDGFADSVVEAITAALSRIRSFFVIARTSAFAYQGRAVPVQQIGRELGVAYVLEGSVQRAGERVRISVQLVETAKGTSLWSDRYDGTLHDVFDLQDRITEQVAGALQPSIRLAEVERSGRKRPQDFGAYDYTMQAMRHVWGLAKEDTDKALALLDKARTLEPDYPLALALSGWCWGQRSAYNWVDDVAQAQARGRELAERAMNLSHDDPLVLAVLGAVYTLARNFGAARVLLERAIQLDPNNAWAYTRLGWLDHYCGRPAEARGHLEHALRLSPLDPANFNVHAGLAAAWQQSGDDQSAAELYMQALRERPSALWIHRHMAPALYGAGRLDEATASVEALMSAYPNFTIERLWAALLVPDQYRERVSGQLRALGVPDK